MPDEVEIKGGLAYVGKQIIGQAGVPVPQGVLRQPIGKRKPGRPRKDGLPVGSPPACETEELAKYPNPSKHVAWGMVPTHPGFKRKGIAVLYNPEHEGGQVTLMPVKEADDGVEGMRWRYRGVPGPMPFHYDKIDLEPGMAAILPRLLRELADTLEGKVKTEFGGVKEADKTTEDYHAGVKRDALGDKIREQKVFG